MKILIVICHLVSLFVLPILAYGYFFLGWQEDLKILVGAMFFVLFLDNIRNLLEAIDNL